MSDTYDNDDDSPLRILPPPTLQWQGDYAIRIEPLTNTYSVCAVHAKSCISGRIATVIMAAKPTLSVEIQQCWSPDPDALDRAVKMAIAECEGQRAVNKGGTRA